MPRKGSKAKSDKNRNSNHARKCMQSKPVSESLTAWFKPVVTPSVVTPPSPSCVASSSSTSSRERIDTPCCAHTLLPFIARRCQTRAWLWLSRLPVWDSPLLLVAESMPLVLKEKETEEKNLDDEMNGAAGKVSDDGAAQDDSMGAGVHWRWLQSDVFCQRSRRGTHSTIKIFVITKPLWTMIWCSSEATRTRKQPTS
jgi:hypothetical protein